MLTSIYKLSVSCVKMEHTQHTRLTALFLGLPGWADTRKVKPIWILLKQETVSGSGISWATCKSASRSIQITMPVPHHSKVFYTPDALPAAQPTASKHWRQRWNNILILNLCYFVLLKIETISLLFLFSFVTQFSMLICYTLMVCWFWSVWPACVLLQKSFVLLSWKGLVRLLRYRLWKVFILHAYCLQPPLSVIY